ncbi:methyltransferase domain-containing protein [Streptomyces yaizuensis]|uniref:Protein-L-isoaspartate O-methyltransferase n=1 Tax=Streptomyces yaizuensis TaxID=2989713 RepID=A0ABQ5P705_9ACTN|nr:methyltransferase domain-containing protein [Streptomyces sp. YSPA8]GLF98255.1 methyltransferase domain-containing protein [Streptomyces sp. YSPA8]
MSHWGKTVDDLVARKVVGPGWVQVLKEVDRTGFTPDTVYAEVPGSVRRYEEVTRSAEPDRWARLVTSPEAVVTQLGRSTVDGGPVPVSSSSAPAAVGAMLQALDLQPGDRVLDLGTGTGWVAALLATYGARVTTVEADPVLAADAAERLARFPEVTVVCGDAINGHADDAPYAAVHAGFAVRRIPAAWCVQTRPGGRIVTPYGSLWSPTGLTRLVRDRDGVASGRFSPRAVNFMWERGQRPVWPEPAGGPARTAASPVDPRFVLESRSGRWATGLQLGDVTFDPVPVGGDRVLRLWALDGSAAAVQVDRNRWADGDGVSQVGQRSLWDEAVAAWLWWTEAGEPNRDRFGLTAGPGEDDVLWLDTPDRLFPRPRAGARPGSPVG